MTGTPQTINNLQAELGAILAPNQKPGSITPTRLLSGLLDTVATFSAATPISVLQYGVVADCGQPGTAITTTLNSVSATIGTAFIGMVAGQTIVIDGIGPLVLQSVSGRNITFTTPASATVTSAKFIYGTDNTAAFNIFFAAMLSQVSMGVIPSGRYLITGTIGVLDPGLSTGQESLTVLCGGAGLNTMRLADMALSAGTSIVWGGTPGGTMMNFARASFVHFIGGIALVGQASYDPSGVFTTFGPRAGLGLLISQNESPNVGTGYETIDEIVCSDMALGIQLAESITDNNCDTSIINRAVFYRCTNGLLVENTQGLSYRFGWIHGVSVPGYVVKSNTGGAFDIGSLHLSACGTASSDPTADTYCLDLSSSLSGFVFKVGLLRIENQTVRTVATRGSTTQLQIGLFEEANSPNVDTTLFYQTGGTIQILGGRLASFFSAGLRPFYLSNDINSKAPRLFLGEMALPQEGQNWSILFFFDANVVADVTVQYPRSDSMIVSQNRNTRLERGPVLIGGQSTDATTAIRLDPFMRLSGTSYVYSLGPRIPLGSCIVDVTVLGDHVNNTPSVFLRRYTFYRATNGTCTVVDTETIGSDVISGTDQIFSIGVDATTFTINLQVKGTAATTVNWRALFQLQSMFSLVPDF